ncbi:MAG: YraN family protein [Lachnospiraceae bacterium]|nr:YraN family protein [Lachnospiraceae bacterium]
MNTRQIGTHYEEAAAAFLEREGIEIVDKNVRCGRIGEIDMIGIESGGATIRPEGISTSSDEETQTLIFFEVKYRKSKRLGYPAEAVDKDKQSKIRRCAEYYLAYKPAKMYVRFDVIAIEGEEINWYKNAF